MRYLVDKNVRFLSKPFFRCQNANLGEIIRHLFDTSVRFLFKLFFRYQNTNLDEIMWHVILKVSGFYPNHSSGAKTPIWGELMHIYFIKLSDFYPKPSSGAKTPIRDKKKEFFLHLLYEIVTILSKPFFRCRNSNLGQKNAILFYIYFKKLWRYNLNSKR